MSDRVLTILSILQRGEIVEWVDHGGGKIVDGQLAQNVDFIIECHGVRTKSAVDSHANHASTHWVRSCLEVSHSNTCCSHRWSIFLYTNPCLCHSILYVFVLVFLSCLFILVKVP